MLLRLQNARLAGGGARYFPFLTWLPMVNRETLVADLLAGLTGAVVTLLQGVAFAIIAGLPPQYGIYAAIAPSIIAALWGSSWHMVSGPTTAISIIILSTVGGFAEPGTSTYIEMVMTLTFMVGLIELGLGLLRLGVLVNFISHTVAIGFMAGAAILIVAAQVKPFFGIDVPRGAPFYEVVRILIDHIADLSPATTAVGTTTVVVGLLSRRFFPKIPYIIVAMVAASIVGAILRLGFGAAVSTLAPLPATLPPLSIPHFSAQVIRDLAPTALALALFALTEAVSIARALAVRSGQQIDGNQEFIGQGLANIVGGLFSGYVATGSFNRSGLNYETGARTPLSTVMSGVMLVPVVLYAGDLAVLLPRAAVAGSLFLVAWGLIDVPHIRQIIQTSRSETTVLAATFLSVLFLDLEFAIFVGVILSLVFYLNRTSHPNVAILAPNPAEPRRRFVVDPALPECPQMKIVRIDGSLYFGAVSNVIAKLRRLEKWQPKQKNLAIIASGINFIDMEGAEALVNEARRRREAGGELFIIGMKDEVAYKLRSSGHLDAIGQENFFDSKTAAIAAIYQRLDSDICETCKARVFRECNIEAPKSKARKTAAKAKAESGKAAGKPAAEAKPEADKAPAEAKPAAKAPAPSRSPASTQRPLTSFRPPARILALIDFDGGAQETARAARELAEETGAELALGHVSSGLWSSGHDFATALISSDALVELQQTARVHLGRIAAEAGITNAVLLASANPDRAQGVRELVGNWNPQTLIVNTRSDLEFAGRTDADLDTPVGRIRCKVKSVGSPPEL